MNKEAYTRALQRAGYTVSCFADATLAAAYLDQAIDGKTVGFGDSMTLVHMGLYDKLVRHNTVHDPQHCDPGMDFFSTAKECLNTEIFITSVNAAAESGELVNIDGTGNRIAGSLFGHDKVYFVLGMNKVCPTLHEAIWRARNIAAPRNAHRLGLKTPCAPKANTCYDCSSKDRICNGLIIHYRKMNDIEMEIVLIDEELGL